jgi:hypothetical protein
LAKKLLFKKRVVCLKMVLNDLIKAKMIFLKCKNAILPFFMKGGSPMGR